MAQYDLLPSLCGTYGDCFNCTLSNCDWNGGTCSNPNDNKDAVSIKDFFTRGKQCGDPKGYCKIEQTKDSFTYKLDGGNGMVEAGYFCMQDFTDVGSNYWSMTLPDWIANTDGDENKFVLDRRSSVYFKESKGDGATYFNKKGLTNSFT